MPSCALCGQEHSEVVGDDAIIPYLTTARHYLFEKLMSAEAFRQWPSPICRRCGADFKVFMHHRGALLAAEFLAHIAQSKVRSMNVRMGLAKARESGKVLGRPRSTTPEQESHIVQLRRSGLGWRQIAKQTGFAHSTIQQILKRAQS